MPVAQRVQARTATNTEVLLGRLYQEWRNPQEDPNAPLIIEEAPSAQARVNHLYVIWEDWANVTPLALTALRQPRRRTISSASVEVGEDQDLNRALSELRDRVQWEYGRPWNKRRYGYYESPSVIRRKRTKMERNRARTGLEFYKFGSLALKVGQRELFERTGPTMAMER